MATGESPFECAVRETREETGLEVATDDLHLFSIIAEKAYEGQSHWLMFLSGPKAASGASSRNSERSFWIFQPQVGG